MAAVNDSNSSLLDVVAGRQALKISVGIDTESLIYLVVGIFAAVLVGVFIAKKIQ